MSTILSSLLPIFGCALGLNIVFMTWRRLSVTWSNWFPLFQKIAKAVLWGSAGVLALFLFSLLVQVPAEVPQWMTFTALGAGLAGSMLFKRLVPNEAPDERTERGARIAAPKEVKALVAKTKKPADIHIGGVPIPRDAEPYHFLVSGSTGSGKSVAIKGLLDTLRERGDTVILVDSGGEFLARYFDSDRDAVLNPFDNRCVPWSPLAEIEGPWDAGALARSIIPDGVGDSKEWNSYAQTFVSSCIQALFEAGRTSLKDLLWAVQNAPTSELSKLLSATPAAAQLGSEKTFGSIRTIASNYFSSYSFLSASTEDAFSVSQFIKREEGGFLYLTYRDDQLDTLRSMLACVLDIAARSILSLAPNPDRRVWLVIDEFASIGKVQSIEAVATKARKVGGCLVLGIQSVAQLKDRYGEHAAQSILSCLSSSLVLRASDVETAEYMSRFLGEAEVVRSTEGQSDSDTGVGSRTWNEQRVTQRLVMASEVQQLANLQGYLKLAGHYPVCLTQLELPKQSDVQAQAFEARDFRIKPQMRVASSIAPSPLGARPASSSAPAKAENPVRSLAELARKSPEVEARPDAAAPPHPLASALAKTSSSEPTTALAVKSTRATDSARPAAPATVGAVAKRRLPVPASAVRAAQPTATKTKTPSQGERVLTATQAAAERARLNAVLNVIDEVLKERKPAAGPAPSLAQRPAQAAKQASPQVAVPAAEAPEQGKTPVTPVPSRPAVQSMRPAKGQPLEPVDKAAADKRAPTKDAGAVETVTPAVSEAAVADSATDVTSNAQAGRGKRSGRRTRQRDLLADAGLLRSDRER